MGYRLELGLIPKTFALTPCHSQQARELAQGNEGGRTIPYPSPSAMHRKAGPVPSLGTLELTLLFMA